MVLHKAASNLRFIPVLFVLFCTAASAGPGNQIEGLWGFEDAADMSCAANPTKVTYISESDQIALTWPKMVKYSDNTESDHVSFTIVRIIENRFALRRDRDGVAATIVLADDLKSFYYFEADETAGSNFTKCESQLSS